MEERGGGGRTLGTHFHEYAPHLTNINHKLYKKKNDKIVMNEGQILQYCKYNYIHVVMFLQQKIH